tara:strand:- start:3490 stop:3801 length:312 start_codon:yes stop_codon:yes gene_type:complete
MKLITKADKIKNILTNWMRQYPDSKHDITRKLRGVITEDEISNIIGNASWTYNPCYECESDCEVVVQIGQEPDYDSCTTNVCLKCLREAVVMATPLVSSTMPH